MAYGDRKPFIIPSGHVRLYRPEHPLANKWGHVMEHRMVAWDHGIITDPRQVVHHINHDPADNRPENLRAMTPSQHAAHHGGQQVKRTRAEYLAAERERYRKRRPQVPCDECGRVFGWSGIEPRGCNNTCRARLRRKAGWRPDYIHDCEMCGREFRSRAGDGRFCGGSCRSNANRQIARAIMAYGNDPCTVGMS